MVMQEPPIKVARAAVDIEPDVSRLVQVARILAKHATAFADELEAVGLPRIELGFPSSWTPEDAEGFRQRFQDALGQPARLSH